MDKIIIFAALLVTIIPAIANAEAPEYRELRNSGAAGRWEVHQYERADKFDTAGQHRAAQEIREYAHQRNENGRNAAKVFEASSK